MDSVPDFKKETLQCDVCRSRSIARYIYGMPGDYRKMLNEQAAGRIIIAGCQYYPGAPHNHCNKCGHDW